MPAFPDTGHHALRRGRTSIRQQVYLLTTTTYRRQRLFADPVRARLASRIIHAASTWGDARLLAWVLMPDHWHGLLELGEQPLSLTMCRFKGTLSRELHRLPDTPARIWTRSFHDHALRADENLRHAARYIIANPVRAALAPTVMDYPYWNAIWLNPPPSPREQPPDRDS